MWPEGAEGSGEAISLSQQEACQIVPLCKVCGIANGEKRGAVATRPHSISLGVILTIVYFRRVLN